MTPNANYFVEEFLGSLCITYEPYGVIGENTKV